jgi:hypothetical protein
MGKYRKKGAGDVSVVVYDLHNVVDFDPHLHHNWIDIAMNELFREH